MKYLQQGGPEETGDMEGQTKDDLARQAVAGTPDIEAHDITHVITVSCTGFFAPGPDYVVVRALGLPGSTERFHVGFMGCFAAFPALRMADAFCRADPDAVVLVVCLELCSLHLQPTRDPDSLVSTSVFADGAAAAVVSARRPQGGAPSLAIEGFASALTPSSEGEMSWSIGDHGFDMMLSSYVPQLLEEKLIAQPADLFHLSERQEDLAKLPGWGSKKVDNLLRAIEARRTIALERFINALGIRFVGESNARLLARHYGKLEVWC